MRIASASPTTGSALASLASAKPSSGSFLAILASASEDQAPHGGSTANNSTESNTESHSDTKSADEKMSAQQPLAARGVKASSTHPAVSLRSVVDRKVALPEQKSESVRDDQTSNSNSVRAASEDATAAYLPTESSRSSFRIAIPITQYSKEIGKPAIVPAAVQSVSQEIASAGTKSVVAKQSAEMSRKSPPVQTESDSPTNATPSPSVPPSCRSRRGGVSARAHRSAIGSQSDLDGSVCPSWTNTCRHLCSGDNSIAWREFFRVRGRFCGTPCTVPASDRLRNCIASDASERVQAANIQDRPGRR